MKTKTLLNAVVMLPNQVLKVTNTDLNFTYSELFVDKFQGVEVLDHVSVEQTMDPEKDYFELKNLDEVPRTVSFVLVWDQKLYLTEKEVENMEEVENINAVGQISELLYNANHPEEQE